MQVAYSTHEHALPVQLYNLRIYIVIIFIQERFNDMFSVNTGQWNEIKISNDL